MPDSYFKGTFSAHLGQLSQVKAILETRSLSHSEQRQTEFSAPEHPT